jgi:TonB family protein
VNRVRAQAQSDQPGVHVDLGSSAVIHRAPVEYPDAAQIKNINGTVSVEVHVDQSGNVSDARVLSGPEELRKPVLESVLGWHFTPGAGGSTRVVNVQFDEPSEEKPRAIAKMATPALDNGVRPEIEQTTEFLRAELERMQVDMVQREAQLRQNQGAAQVQEAELRAREAQQLAELQAKLAMAETAQRLWKVGPVPESFGGRTLRSIRLAGVGISKADFLAQAQLPIREGDALTKESMEAAGAAVKKFDEHLSVFWSAPVDSDGSVDLMIVAPGGRGSPNSQP